MIVRDRDEDASRGIRVSRALYAVGDGSSLLASSRKTEADLDRTTARRRRTDLCVRALAGLGSSDSWIPRRAESVAISKSSIWAPFIEPIQLPQ